MQWFCVAAIVFTVLIPIIVDSTGVKGKQKQNNRQQSAIIQPLDILSNNFGSSGLGSSGFGSSGSSSGFGSSGFGSSGGSSSIFGSNNFGSNNFGFGSSSPSSSSSGSSHTSGGSATPGNASPASSLFTRLPPLPAPQLLDDPPPAGPEPAPGEPPPPVVEDTRPLGLQKLILIMVPQFKMKLKKTPKWWGANVKFSMPTTVFMDKLRVPSRSPPLVLFPFGPVFPPRRVRRNTENDSILSLPPPESVRGGERAILVPRIENMLKSYGIDGRGCLLRAVCEVHETSLKSSYGFLGEVLTLLFSISNSPYAKSHLREYLIAEDMGRNGSCESYHQNCTESLLRPHDDED